MSIIEGVGDEVTIFVTILFILMGLLLAWLTTTLSPQSLELPNEDVPQNLDSTPHDVPDSGLDADQSNASDTSGNLGDEPPENSESELRRRSPEASGSNETSADPPTPDASPGVDPSQRLDGHIRLKIKYLDEREKVVQVRPDENIADFKRVHFARELADNLLVRLIFNGQELRQDASTLSSYNISDMSVVHCLVTRSSRPLEQNGQNDIDTMEIDLSNLMFPLFGLILALIWYCRIAYRNFFNAMSTLALIGITILFVFACVITLRNNRPHEQYPQPHPQAHGHQE